MTVTEHNLKLATAYYLILLDQSTSPLGGIPESHLMLLVADAIRSKMEWDLDEHQVLMAFLKAQELVTSEAYLVKLTARGKTKAGQLSRALGV